jgi:hypothetical protein
VFVRLKVITAVVPQKLALTSSKSGGRSAGTVRLRAQATEFVYFFGNFDYKKVHEEYFLNFESQSLFYFIKISRFVLSPVFNLN